MDRDDQLIALQEQVDFYKSMNEVWQKRSMKHLNNWSNAMQTLRAATTEIDMLRYEASMLRQELRKREEHPRGEEGKILVDKEELQEFNAQFIELLWRYQDYVELQESTEKLEKFKKWMERVEEKLDKFSYRLD